MSTREYLGRGWGMPLAPDRGGVLARADGPEKVRQSIALILDTDPGERIMRPAFGCGLRRYLMKPNTVAIRALIQHDVTRALARWEPRIQATSITVTAGDDPALVIISIAYVHVRDGRPGNFVYPFYLEP